AATNRDLEVAVETGTFRRDLYFRIDGVSLFIPPLRERAGEIAPLARELVASAASKFGHDRPPAIAKEALERLLAHRWPGNIRELRNVVERAVLLCGRGEIRTEHLHLHLHLQARGRADGMAPALALARDSGDLLGERRRVIEALERC